MLGAKDSVDDQFMEMIDDLVVMSEKDSELAEGLDGSISSRRRTV